MGKRGPKPGTGGRPKKALYDNIIDGNPGKRSLQVLDETMNHADQDLTPPPYLNENGIRIFNQTVDWLKPTGILGYINPAHIAEYAKCKERWLECENGTIKNLLAKHPTTGQPMQSPYVEMGLKYLRQADVAWSKIYDVVKENATVEFRPNSPNSDVMESLLSMKTTKKIGVDDMKQSKCEIKDIPISELKQSKYNPRKNLKPGDTEYEKLKNSILNFGYVEPVIWNKRSGNIVGGHQRAKVMQDLGYESITCIVVDLDDLQEKTLNIALNKITGEWDIPLLTDLLKEIDNSDFDVCLTGFEPEELGEMFGEVNPDDLTGDDFDVEAEYENINTPFTELGDVWCIGNHRLMCGDSTSKDDVSELIDGNVMDMCFTDPPYNVNYESANTGKIINDNMSDNEFLTFLIAAFKMIVFSLKPGGAFYICHADSEGLNFRKAVKSVGLLMKQCIIWVKNSFVLGRQDYHWQHEPILYGWKDGAAHYFTDDRTKSTVIDDWKDTDFSKMKKFELIEFLNKLKTEQNVSTSIIREDKPKRNPDHPTMKPIRLCARCIQNSCRRNEKVIDLFGGSGSTLIACEQINRSAYLMELDPKFCDVIVRRYIQTFHDSKNIFLIRNGQKMTFEDLEF